MKVSLDYILTRATPVVLVVLLLASCTGTSTESPEAPAETPAATSQGQTSQPSIEGTYRLVSRELADGTKLQGADVMGLFTYTRTRRNFNISVKDSQGRTFTSRMAEYRLTSSDYSETNVLTITNDENDRSRGVYNTIEATKSAPVKIDGGRIEFQLDGEPVLVFEGTKLTATMAGEFVDVWEKVE